MQNKTLYELILALVKAKINGWDATSVWFEISDLLHSVFDERSATYLYRVLKHSDYMSKKLKELEEENERLRELLKLDKNG